MNGVSCVKGSNKGVNWGITGDSSYFRVWKDLCDMVAFVFNLDNWTITVVNSLL